ncbi:hypothetical protein CPB85DRAFT_1327571 [Mucidula mucida]|nr:hypothetical protein CPB85DRAFT_1327571 [Mucidula mucida]
MARDTRHTKQRNKRKRKRQLRKLSTTCWLQFAKMNLRRSIDDSTSVPVKSKQEAGKTTGFQVHIRLKLQSLPLEASIQSTSSCTSNHGHPSLPIPLLLPSRRRRLKGSSTLKSQPNQSRRVVVRPRLPRYVLLMFEITADGCTEQELEEGC